MESRDFLEALLPSEGFFALGSLATGQGGSTPKLKTAFYRDIESLVSDAEQEQAQGRDVYVTPATFQNSNNRQASNAAFVKSFFLDLDVGQGAGKYLSKRHALTALQTFLTATGLPTPSLIDSGGGVHVYWILESPLSIRAWYPLAVRLKKLCLQQKFMIDPTVTADAARVMRLAGSMNFKRAKPSAVKHFAGEVSVEDIESVLNKFTPMESWLAQAQTEWMKASNLAKTEGHTDRVCKFAKIVRRSLTTDTGCAQIAHAVTDQRAISEPLWRATLSIAWHCEDAETAVHKASNQHPEYDHDVTIAKAMATKGPYHCVTFEGLNPSKCEGCPHRGKITSPIVLGGDLKKSEIVEGKGYAAKPAEAYLEKLNEATPTFIPEYPKPFFRPASGGLALAGEDESEVFVITDTDIWVERLIQDPYVNTMSMWMRTWHKHQGYADFSIPYCVNQGNELTKHLENNGVIFDKKAESAIRRYVFTAVKQLHNTQKSITASNQMGWAKDHSSFIVGDTRYKRGGTTEFAPPSNYTAPIVGMMTPRGTLAGWQSAAQLYFNDTENLGAWQTMVLAAFASPLYTFTGKTGLVISFASGRSGLGKTTAQKVGVSAFGDPKHLLLTIRDTYKSKMERLGVLQNLPVALEETTMMKPEELVSMTYSITEGRPNNQANQHGGGEKISDRTWSLLVTSSSNVSLLQAINGANIRHNPEANLARIFEIPVSGMNTIGTQNGLRIESDVHANYGHAGRAFMTYILENIDTVHTEILELQDKMYAKLRAEPKHRYIVAGVTTLIYAAEVLNKIGLLKIDTVAYARYILSAAKGYSEDVAQTLSDRGDVLSDFIRTHIRGFVLSDTNLVGDNVIRDPDRIVAPVMGRVEFADKALYIPVHEFKKFCMLRGEDYKGALDSLRKQKVLMEGDTKQIRITKGLPAGGATLAVRCLRFTLDAVSVDFEGV